MWNGTAWSGLGSGISNGQVRVIIGAPNGDLIVGGDFAGPVPNTNSIARWNGTAWSSLGTTAFENTSGVLVVNGAVFMPNGDLVVSGQFTSAGGTDLPPES
jgi:hypothetical protein